MYRAARDGRAFEISATKRDGSRKGASNMPMTGEYHGRR